MGKPVRIGLLGNGSQMRTWYLPYLESRASNVGDMEITWLSGCQCSERERENCPGRAYRPGNQCSGLSTDWTRLIDEVPVDAVVISTPNDMHCEAAYACLSRKICVAVDKPTAISAASARENVALASASGIVFATLAQRRYERLYQELDNAFACLGEVRLINYVIAHGLLDPSDDLWRTRRALSGGGVLIDSAYHGIDVLLWLLGRQHPPVRATRVSAVLDCSPLYGGEVEDSLAATIRLDNGGILNLSASYLAPRGSVDESFLIYGTEATARVQRHRVARASQSAPSLTIQSRDGAVRDYDTLQWVGDRLAPLREFIDTVILWKKGTAWKLTSPASDSVDVLAVIDAAYASARFAGVPIGIGYTLPGSVDHVAVQTNDLDVSLRFYVEVLGARLLERRRFKKREMAWIDVGNTRLELFSKRTGEQLQPWSDFYVGPVHLAFRVADLDALLHHARALGARLHPSHPEPFVPIEGARRIAYLLGPDGEEIEIRDA